jgi:hypothetical protein
MNVEKKRNRTDRRDFIGEEDTLPPISRLTSNQNKQPSSASGDVPLVAVGNALERVSTLLPLCNELFANANATVCSCKELIKLFRKG